MPQLVYEDSFSAYSDAFKDLYGFRPRGRVAELFLGATEAEQTEMLEQVYADLAEELERERKAKAEFLEKVAACGLDPVKYAYLWEEYN